MMTMWEGQEQTVDRGYEVLEICILEGERSTGIEHCSAWDLKA